MAKSVLSMLMLRDLKYSVGSGVRRVFCVLFAFILRLFSIAQVEIAFRHGC